MTEDSSREFFHRKYLVDWKFQFKYTFLVVIVSAIIFAALGFQLYQKTVSNTEILKIQNPEIAGMVNVQDRQILYLLFGAFILQVSSLFVLGILITHRIAGPVHRVQRYLDHIAESGELKTFSRIRNRDEFHDFFESLSRVVERFQKKKEDQKIKINELQSALNTGDSENAKKLAKDLSTLI